MALGKHSAWLRSCSCIFASFWNMACIFTAAKFAAQSLLCKPLAYYSKSPVLFWKCQLYLRVKIRIFHVKNHEKSLCRVSWILCRICWNLLFGQKLNFWNRVLHCRNRKKDFRNAFLSMLVKGKMHQIDEKHLTTTTATVRWCTTPSSLHTRSRQGCAP